MGSSEMFTIIISVLALIMSTVVGTVQIIEYLNTKKESDLSRAPIFTISSIIFQPGDYKFPDTYSKPGNSEFILEKRHYLHSNNLEDAVISLIIDACPKNSNSKKIEIINFDIFTIENIGFEAVYYEIMNINIYKQIGGVINIKATKQNKIIKRINTTDPIIFYVSLIINSESGIIDSNLLLDESFENNKIQQTGGELLNSTLNEMADLWERIVIEVKTKNTYNEYYRQTLTIYIENNTYFADQSEPVRIT